MSPNGRIRLFVALPVPLEVARPLAALVPPELEGLKRVGPELLHVTLAFIGWTGEGSVEPVAEAIRGGAALESPFRIPITEVGPFPPTDRPRAIAAGAPAAGAAIRALGAAVREGLARAGIPYDAKPLLPHITLARVREEASAEERRAVLAAVRAVRPPSLAFRADAVHVMQSTLTPRGPRYASRSMVRLGLPNGRA